MKRFIAFVDWIVRTSCLLFGHSPGYRHNERDQLVRVCVDCGKNLADYWPGFDSNSRPFK